MKNIKLEQHEKHLEWRLRSKIEPNIRKGFIRGNLEPSIAGILVEGGVLKRKPIVLRELSGASEFIDVYGQTWSIKSFDSRFPPKKGGYSLEKAMDNIKRSLAENENIILDICNMYTHKDELLEELSKWKNRRLVKKIVVWPRGNENIIDLLMQYQFVINLVILKDDLFEAFYKWRNRKLK